MILDSFVDKERYLYVLGALTYCEENDLEQCKEVILSYIERIYPHYYRAVAELNCLETFKKVIDRIVVTGGVEMLNISTERSPCLLSITCMSDNSDQIRYLIKKESRIDTVDYNELQPMHYASMNKTNIY